MCSRCKGEGKLAVAAGEVVTFDELVCGESLCLCASEPDASRFECNCVADRAGGRERTCVACGSRLLLVEEFEAAS